MIATSYGKRTASGSGQGLEFLDGRRGLARRETVPKYRLGATHCGAVK
jgi:hypothetical protein